MNCSVQYYTFPQFQYRMLLAWHKNLGSVLWINIYSHIHFIFQLQFEMNVISLVFVYEVSKLLHESSELVFIGGV